MRPSLSSILLLAFAASGAAVLGAASCDESGAGGSGTSGGAGGAGGCPSGPQAMLVLTVKAADGPVPPDTSVDVTWSAKKEPTFRLDDPATWKTLDDDVNVVCDVDPKKPPPTDLPALVCQLWTSGATQVVVRANGYEEADETFSPELSDLCEGPVPTGVSVVLTPVAPDAGHR